nr:PREDICTED: probable WRKY transcription factor 32 isoform X2 [Musa acuminata subsp. malaccensis]
MTEEKASSSDEGAGRASVDLGVPVAEEKATSDGGDLGRTAVDLEASMSDEKASSAGEKAGREAGGTSTLPSSDAEEHLPADRGAGPAAAAEGGAPDAAPPTPNTGGRSFSQLLAGAMASPTGSPHPAPIVTVPVVAVPCFLTPAALIESQGFAGQFAMTHQAVLATVTAQAQMQLQAKTSGDVYNWRKYGQKQVKSSENARSYYRCTDSNCSAKKKVERCPDGTIIEVIYRGKHNHDPPHKHRYTKDRGSQSGGPPLENDGLEHPSIGHKESDPSSCKTEQKSSNETPKQQLYCSSDCLLDVGTKSEEDIVDEPDPKRRLCENSKSSSAPVLKTIREYIVQTEIDARHLTDGYRWRKYGQKFVKGNRNPRSYYRCTHSGCPVRKHVERVPHDAKALLITYEGEHNHEQPSSKYASETLSTTAKSNIAAGVASEQLGISGVQSVKKLSDKSHPNNVLKKVVSDPELELGGDRALESAQTLLSIGCSPTSAEGTAASNSECMKSPIFKENPAVVSVQNT